MGVGVVAKCGCSSGCFGSGSCSFGYLVIDVVIACVGNLPVVVNMAVEVGV